MENKKLNEANLEANELKALRELKSRLLEKFSDAKIILYGSKARGDSTPESDIDVVILVDEFFIKGAEDEVITIAFEIDLKYDVVFSVVVNSKSDWNSSLTKEMPFYREVSKYGVAL